MADASIEEEPLTPADVARIFKVHPTTVAGWAEGGLLPSFRTPGGHRRFWRKDVEAFINGKPEPIAHGAA